MAWLFWLAGPVIATCLAAVWSWLRARPDPVPDTAEAMRAHSDYLSALGRPPRAAQRDLRGD